MNQKNCIVAQSGGPTAAINASLAGVLHGVCNSDMYDTCYGAVHGILGVLEDNFVNLSELAKEDSEFITRMKITPSMYLGSCRHKLPNYKDDDSPYIFIFRQFEKYNVKAFFYIGGNDSMDTVLKLSEYAEKINSDVRIIGIPKTIDNDLCATDHTPGFGSAAKYVASSILEIAHDTFIYPVKSVTIVEIMGRDAGWLTASAALARNDYSDVPQLIYLPEVNFNVDAFLTDIKDLLKKHNNIIVAVSEGIHDENGDYITAAEATNDTFGHRQLSGVGKALEMIVKENIPVKVRSIEMNILQRCAGHIASATDISESFEQGAFGVQLAEQGITGSMVCIERTSDAPYTIQYTYQHIDGIANAAKSVPLSWINEAGNNVTDEMITYLTPLIQGETSITYENGLPFYANIKHLSEI